MRLISREELVKLVQNRLHDSNITNVGIFLLKKGSKISAFKDMLERVVSGKPLYIVIPSKSDKDSNGNWMHDLVNFKIYKADKSYLQRYNLEDLFANLENNIELPISNEILIYDSSQGEVQAKTEYNELNMYQKVCLELKLPMSGLDWLDNLIRIYNDKNNK